MNVKRRLIYWDGRSGWFKESHIIDFDHPRKGAYFAGKRDGRAAYWPNVTYRNLEIDLVRKSRGISFLSTA